MLSSSAEACWGVHWRLQTTSGCELVAQLVARFTRCRQDMRRIHSVRDRDKKNAQQGSSFLALKILGSKGIFTYGHSELV